MSEEKKNSERALETKVISEVEQCIEKLKKEMEKQDTYYKVEEKKDNLLSVSENVGERMISKMATGIRNRKGKMGKYLTDC